MHKVPARAQRPAPLAPGRTRPAITPTVWPACRLRPSGTLVTVCRPPGTAKAALARKHFSARKHLSPIDTKSDRDHGRCDECCGRDRGRTGLKGHKGQNALPLSIAEDRDRSASPMTGDRSASPKTGDRSASQMIGVRANNSTGLTATAVGSGTKDVLRRLARRRPQGFTVSEKHLTP